MQGELTTAWSRGDPGESCLLQGVECHGLILNQGRARVRSEFEEVPVPLQIARSVRPAISAPGASPHSEPLLPSAARRTPSPGSFSSLPSQGRALPAAKCTGGPGAAPRQRDHHAGDTANPSGPLTSREKRCLRPCTFNTLLLALISLPASPARRSPMSLSLNYVWGPQHPTPGCHGEAGPRRRVRKGGSQGPQALA